jgi:DNA-binding MarR family transcriptional regulator
MGGVIILVEEITDMGEFEVLLQQIVRQLNQHIRCFLTKKGMSLSRYWVINNLSTDRPLTMGKMQKRLGLSSATLTGLVDGLVDTGLVHRWRDDDDRRVIFLTLTPHGDSLRTEIDQYRCEVLRSALAGQQIAFDSLNDALNTVLSHLKLYCTKLKEGLTNIDGCQGGA